MTEKVTIEVMPVAWAGDKVLKYQASASLKVSPKRTVRILGDPAFTQAKAFEKLESELSTWKHFVTLTQRDVTVFKDRNYELLNSK